MATGLIKIIKQKGRLSPSDMSDYNVYLLSFRGIDGSKWDDKQYNEVDALALADIWAARTGWTIKRLRDRIVTEIVTEDDV